MLSPRAFHALAALTWRARLPPTEPGWLDLAMASPLLSSERAHEVLGCPPLSRPAAGRGASVVS